VQFLSIYPGDPTTPGYPAYENAERIEGTNVPKIPSLPISWQNAQRLLEEIHGTYTSTPDGKRVLSGRASKTNIRLANYGECRYSLNYNVQRLSSGYQSDTGLECHGYNSWTYQE
jgi:N-acetylated-alpha-linked acidic dipeptidase